MIKIVLCFDLFKNISLHEAAFSKIVATWETQFCLDSGEWEGVFSEDFAYNFTLKYRGPREKNFAN